MTQKLKVNEVYTVGGLQIAAARTIEAETVLSQERSVPAAKAGTLSTRTDDNTGVATLGASHGVVDGDRVDVYWSTGSRLGMTVGTVSGTSVPIDGGAGDNLPAQTTVIQVAVCQEATMLFDGDELSGLIVGATAKASIVFADGSDATLHTVAIAAANLAKAWLNDTGETNPLAGDDVVKVFVSHADTTAAKVIKIAAMLDN